MNARPTLAVAGLAPISAPWSVPGRGFIGPLPPRLNRRFVPPALSVASARGPL